MMTYKHLVQLAKDAGFTSYAPLDVSTIKLQPEVRDMCANGSCGQYGKNWSCPPGCGTLEECEERLQGFVCGILVQTVGEIEDSYDVEAMMEAEVAHKNRFREMYAALRNSDSHILALGAGCCTRCAACTYPGLPCRFPDEMTSSMEAFGMLVQEICRANHLTYYYGPDRIAYTSCFLL